MWLLSAIWGAIGLFDLVKAEFLPERIQQYTVIRLLHFISWRTWTIVFLVLLIGVLLEGGHAAIQRRNNSSLPTAANGPDVVLDWESSSKNWDKVKLRNIGTTSAFKVELDKFSWPELLFSEPIKVNVIHPDTPEIIVHPHFTENIGTVSNIGRLDAALRLPHFNDREPLEVMITFQDSSQREFSRSFKLAPGPGGDWGPNVHVTPLKLDTKN